MAETKSNRAEQQGYHDARSGHDYEKPNDLFAHIFSSYSTNAKMNDADHAYDRGYTRGERDRNR